MYFDILRSEHLDSLYALERMSFTVPWTWKAFADDLSNENACYTLLCEEDTVIGYCAFWQAEDVADITNVAVHPDYRRRGLGKKLLEEALRKADARGVRQMFLEVRVSNAAARALYAAFGFFEVGLREKYYADNNEDALIMVKEW